MRAFSYFILVLVLLTLVAQCQVISIDIGGDCTYGGMVELRVSPSKRSPIV